MFKRVMFSCAAIAICLFAGVSFAGCSEQNVRGQTYEFDRCEVVWDASNHMSEAEQEEVINEGNEIYRGVKIKFGETDKFEMSQNEYSIKGQYTQNGNIIRLTPGEGGISISLTLSGNELSRTIDTYDGTGVMIFVKTGDMTIFRKIVVFFEDIVDKIFAFAKSI